VHPWAVQLLFLGRAIPVAPNLGDHGLDHNLAEAVAQSSADVVVVIGVVAAKFDRQHSTAPIDHRNRAARIPEGLRTPPIGENIGLDAPTRATRVGQAAADPGLDAEV
jgi:hypothetical protein